MHTKEFARTLRAFAELAEFQRSEELYRFASFLEQDSNETILARMKRTSRSTAYPSRLKNSLEAIEIGFRSSGASKQTNAFRAILKAFDGRPGASIEAFIAEISVSPEIVNFEAKRLKSADLALVKGVVSQLTEPGLDADAFEVILAGLSSSNFTRIATLALIANCYLGNRRIYRDRKSALEAIEKHFRANTSVTVRPCEMLG